MSNISCIYKIYNIIDNKCYIGKSINFKERKGQHLSCLRGNSHCNIYLQRAYNKYKEENFIFEIIEICDKNLLNEKEVYYIQIFNTINKKYGYNLTNGGDGGITSLEKHPYEKTVYQYDKLGNFIKKWKNAREVHRQLGYSWNKISAVCLGKRTSSNNYIWSYNKQEKINPFKSKRGLKTTHKAIEQYTLDNVFIREFKSFKEACNFLNKKQTTSLIKSVRHSDGIIYGYKWKYKTIKENQK